VLHRGVRKSRLMGFCDAKLFHALTRTIFTFRFLAEAEKLVLHAGVRKSGLMGFCDCAPGEMKHLRLAYLAAGRPHTATLTESQVRCRQHNFRAAHCS